MDISIRSITDVITNSSSTALCLKMDCEYDDLKQFMIDAGVWDDTFIEIKTLDDVKKIVMSSKYRGWNDWVYDSYYSPKNAVEPKIDSFNEDRKKIVELFASGKSADEIWNLYKDNYEPLVGHAFGDFDHDGCENPELDAIYEFWGIKYQEKLKKFFDNLTPGKIYACHIMDDREQDDDPLWNLYPEDFIIVYLGNKEKSFDAVYNPGYLPRENYVIFDCDYILSVLDLKTWREAKPEEIEVLKSNLKNKGYIINGTQIKHT